MASCNFLKLFLYKLQNNFCSTLVEVGKKIKLPPFQTNFSFVLPNVKLWD